MNNNYLWFLLQNWKGDESWHEECLVVAVSLSWPKYINNSFLCYVIYDCTSTTILISLLKTIIIGFNTCKFPHYFILSALTGQAGVGMQPSWPSENSSRILDTKKWILGSKLPNNLFHFTKIWFRMAVERWKIPCKWNKHLTFWSIIHWSMNLWNNLTLLTEDIQGQRLIDW